MEEIEILLNIINVAYKTIFHQKICLGTDLQANTHFAPNFDLKNSIKMLSSMMIGCVM